MKRIISWLQANLSRSKSVFPPVNPANTTPEKDDLDLEDVDPDASDADKSTEFDPYDTGVLQKK